MRFWKSKPKEIKQKYLIVEHTSRLLYNLDDAYKYEEYTNMYESENYLDDIEKLDGESFDVFIRLDNGTYYKTATIHSDDEEDEDDEGPWFVYDNDDDDWYEEELDEEYENEPQEPSESREEILKKLSDDEILVTTLESCKRTRIVANLDSTLEEIRNQIGAKGYMNIDGVMTHDESKTFRDFGYEGKSQCWLGFIIKADNV